MGCVTGLTGMTVHERLGPGGVCVLIDNFSLPNVRTTKSSFLLLVNDKLTNRALRAKKV